MFSMPTKESVKFQRVADDSLFTIVCEFQQGDIALPFAEFLLRNLLSISPDHTHLPCLCRNATLRLTIFQDLAVLFLRNFHFVNCRSYWPFL
jgi:hypothetical protein